MGVDGCIKKSLRMRDETPPFSWRSSIGLDCQKIVLSKLEQRVDTHVSMPGAHAFTHSCVPRAPTPCEHATCPCAHAFMCAMHMHPSFQYMQYMNHAHRFTEWPADALFEVASKQLEGEDLGSEEVKSNVCKVMRAWMDDGRHARMCGCGYEWARRCVRSWFMVYVTHLLPSVGFITEEVVLLKACFLGLQFALSAPISPLLRPSQFTCVATPCIRTRPHTSAPPLSPRRCL